MLLHYARFDMMRTIRNPRFLVMTVLFPVLVNIVFVKITAGRLPAAQLQLFATSYMMSMAAFATVSACLSTAGHRLSQERSNGWFTFLTLTPLRPIDIVGGKILTALGVGIPAVLAVFLSSVLVNGVRVAPLALLAALGVVTLGSVAFASLGVIIGLATSGESSYAASMIALMFFAIVGGLWIPRESMPSWLSALTEFTPSYQISHVGSAISTGVPISLSEPLLIFVLWAVAFVFGALMIYRRSATIKR